MPIFACVFVLLDTESFYIAPTGLILTLKTTLSLNWPSTLFGLPSAEIPGICHHTQVISFVTENAKMIGQFVFYRKVRLSLVMPRWTDQWLIPLSVQSAEM